jgi:hypothetical protein
MLKHQYLLRLLTDKAIYYGDDFADGLTLQRHVQGATLHKRP